MACKFIMLEGLRNHARLIFSANELPPSNDRSYSFFRRWLIVPFTRCFPEGSKERDGDLRSKLSRPQELSGLLNRALGGLRRLFANKKFTIPPQVEAEIEKYRRISDSVREFLTECARENVRSRTRKVLLRRTYETWCDDWGFSAVSDWKFKESLLRTFPNVNEVRPDASGPRYWKGIELTGDAPEPRE